MDAHNRRIHLLDLTIDGRLPVVVAVAYRTDANPDPIYGMGCHRTTSQAASRAIGEVIQGGALTVPTHTRLSRADVTPEIHDLAMMRRDQLGWMFPKGISTTRDEDHGGDTEDQVSKDLFGQTVVVDISQRSDEPTVVKVICPEAPHFWHRLGIPKLYTLPVEYGWLDKAPKEEDANPLYIAT